MRAPVHELRAEAFLEDKRKRPALPAALVLSELRLRILPRRVLHDRLLSLQPLLMRQIVSLIRPRRWRLSRLGIVIQRLVRIVDSWEGSRRLDAARRWSFHLLHSAREGPVAFLFQVVFKRFALVLKCFALVLDFAFLLLEQRVELFRLALVAIVFRAVVLPLLKNLPASATKTSLVIVMF